MSRQAEQLRLGLLRAVESGLRRREEVLAVIAAAENRADASAAVQRLLGLNEVQAQAVLGLQWADLTKDRVKAMSDEIAQQAASGAGRPERDS